MEGPGGKWSGGKKGAYFHMRTPYLRANTLSFLRPHFSDLVLLRRLHPTRLFPGDTPDPLRYGVLWRGRVLHLSTRDALRVWLRVGARWWGGGCAPWAP